MFRLLSQLWVVWLCIANVSALSTTLDNLTYINVHLALTNKAVPHCFKRVFWVEPSGVSMDKHAYMLRLKVELSRNRRYKSEDILFNIAKILDVPPGKLALQCTTDEMAHFDSGPLLGADLHNKNFCVTYKYAYSLLRGMY